MQNREHKQLQNEDQVGDSLANANKEIEDAWVDFATPSAQGGDLLDLTDEGRKVFEQNKTT